MQNLRDKLLKAGLVSDEQATKAAEASSKPRGRPLEPPRAPPAGRPSYANRPPPNRAPQVGSRPERQTPSGPLLTVRRQPLGEGAFVHTSSIPKLAPLPGSKAHQRIESKKQSELERQLRELVLAHQVPIEFGEVVFYFVTRKGKLRRLELTQAQAHRLENGELAVVERPEPSQIDHSLVPAEAAEKMLALNAKSVRFFNRPQSPVGFLTEDALNAHKAAGDESTDPGAPEVAEAAAPEEVTPPPADDACV